MKVLVTGGAGFIGSYVCEALLRNGYGVRILDNLEPQVHGPGQVWPDYLPVRAEKILGDVRERMTVKSALNGCQAVVHLASSVGVGQSMYEIEKYSSVNVVGTAVLLEELVERRDQIKKLIVASSMSIYGEGAYMGTNGDIICPDSRSSEQLKASQWELLDDKGCQLRPIPTTEKKTPKPESVYAINKRDQEEMCLVVGKAYGIPTVAFRMFNVYGPRQALSNPYTGAIAIFCSRLLNNKSPVIFEDGYQKRDFIYVEDVAEAYIKALETDAADGFVLNLGSGNAISIIEVATLLASILRVKIAPVVKGLARDGDVRHCFADIGLIRDKLNWKPEYSFERGLDILIGWLRDQRADDRTNDAYSDLEKRGLLK